MPFLPGLSVVFVGVVGGKSHNIENQVQQVIDTANIERTNVPAATVRTLARHAEGSREFVANLHVDGLIGGELVVEHHQLSLHLVVYNGEGVMKSYNEIAIAGRVLTKTELEVLHDNLVDEISALVVRQKGHAQPIIAPVAKIEATPYTAPKVAAKPAKPAKKGAIADPFATAEIEMDAEAAPLAPSTRKAAPVETPHEAAPVETADASADSVSAAELEALTSGAETDQAATGIISTAALSGDSLKIAAELGIGFAGRGFSPGPSTVAAYSASPVGAVYLAGHVQPTERTRLDASIERTLAMSTPLAGNTTADTAMTRWEVDGSYALGHGVRGLLGLGHRSFSIDSIDPARSPDADYNYAILGAAAALPIGDKITLEGKFAIEPVLGGNDATQMSFGAASRWAADAGIAAELRPIHHVFVRASLDYQRFSWSWDAAGTRGAGGAVDAYPSGMLSLGAQM